MKNRILACAVALLTASFAYAQPAMSVGTPGSGTPTQSIGSGGASVGATAPEKAAAAAPVRSIGSGGKGQGAGTGATPIEVISTLSSAVSPEPSIKVAVTGSSVTVGDPVKVMTTLPEGAAAATINEGTTPNAKGPAPRN